MKIQFIGATHEVTGSCTLLEVCGKKYLVDCGMEQGIDVFENVPIPVPANTVEAVFLTHPTLTIPVCYRSYIRTVSGAVFMQPPPLVTFVTLCCGTPPIFKNLRQSGRTGKHSVPVMN